MRNFIRDEIIEETSLETCPNPTLGDSEDRSNVEQNLEQFLEQKQTIREQRFTRCVVIANVVGESVVEETHTKQRGIEMGDERERESQRRRAG